VGFVLTARPGAARPPAAHQVPVDRPGEEVIAAYLRQRGVPEGHLRLLVGKAGGSWLHAHLLAEQAVRPGFHSTRVPAGTTPELTALYEAELLTAGAGNPDRWQTQLRPVLAVLAVVGAGPVLPLPLACFASDFVSNTPVGNTQPPVVRTARSPSREVGTGGNGSGSCGAVSAAARATGPPRRWTTRATTWSRRRGDAVLAVRRRRRVRPA
jgi:hypothetical protein